MKVNDYVRTKSGYLRRIIAIYNGYVEVDDKCFNSYANVQIENNIIIKSSPNIIDLIEVGDYVNGYPVEEVYQPINKEIGKLIKFSTDNVSVWEYEAEEITETDIKSIVTKEQFEQMEYKVGEIDGKW